MTAFEFILQIAAILFIRDCMTLKKYREEHGDCVFTKEEFDGKRP